MSSRGALGGWVFLGFIAPLALVLMIRVVSKRVASWPGLTRPLAAVTAYLVYVSAALFANAPITKFLRNHLVDGFAAAAALVILIDRILNEPSDLRGKRPVIGLLAFFLGAAVLCAAIGAAAVFSSGKNDFAFPVGFVAGIGALDLTGFYALTIYEYFFNARGDSDERFWRWLLRKH
jgi:hypothetical protein